MRKLLSAFLKEVEDFLVTENILDDKFYKKVRLSELLNERQISRYFLQHTEKSIADIKSSEVQNVDMLLYLYRLQSAVYNFELSRRRRPDLAYQEVFDSFQNFISLNTLNHAVGLLNLKNILKSDYDLPLLQFVLQHLGDDNLEENPLLKVHYYAYRILHESGEMEDFEQFKTTLFECENNLESSDLRNFYTIAINYCVQKINIGEPVFSRVVFEIYTNGLENRAIYLRGILPSSTYQNIVTIALRLDEIQWVEEFIEQYKQDIPREGRESIYGVSLARLEFQKQNFSGVTDILYPLRIKDYFTQLAAKALMLKAYYEMSEYEFLDSQIDNFIQLVNRRKLLAYHKTNFNTFARYMKRLKNLNRYDKKAAGGLREKIEKEPILTEKEWFLDKLEEVGVR